MCLQPLKQGGGEGTCPTSHELSFCGEFKAPFPSLAGAYCEMHSLSNCYLVLHMRILGLYRSFISYDPTQLRPSGYMTLVAMTLSHVLVNNILRTTLFATPDRLVDFSL